MSGIASAQEHSDTLRRLDVCPQCGIEEGERHPTTGKKMTCMPVAKAIVGHGVVCFCSTKCQQQWTEEQQVRLP